MSECYQCGAWIERGAGFRRDVDVGTFTSVHLSRPGGSSFGFMTGTRTVCAKCAQLMDELNSGRVTRLLLFVGGWMLSFLLGVSMITSGSAFLGTVFLLGIPALIPTLLYEHWRRDQIIERLDTAYPPEALRPGEKALDWFDRVLPRRSHLDYDLLVRQSLVDPPIVGDTLQEWIDSWELAEASETVSSGKG